MLSPTMTVAVLCVLWLIVVVPMIVRRKDERSRDRSIAGFGHAMRALGRRAASADVFVPARARSSQSLSGERVETTAPPLARRPPVPTAQEALMFPVDQGEMSAARAAMMRRRRRSLATLVLGSLMFTIAALAFGGLLWAPSAVFLLGLGGYLYFLRGQALKDQARRSSRQGRARDRVDSRDLTEDAPSFAPPPESVVRIDDDDLELMNMDTIDLTGIYSEELAEPVAVRRAS